MPGQVIGTSLCRGYPGTFSRQNILLAVARVAGADIPFGATVQYDASGNVIPMDANGTAAKFLGIASREVKQAESYDGNTFGQYAAKELATIITQGAVSVVCNVGTPTVNGSVYLRVKANEAIEDGIVGGLEASADSTNTVELTNVRWTSDGKDDNNVAEIRILYPVNA